LPRRALRRRSFGRLVLGASPAAGRIAYYNLWFRRHNNRRSEELVPRLDRVDPYLFRCPDRQPLRGMGYRMWRRSRPIGDRAVLSALARRYGQLFSTDVEQVAHFDGDVVVDIDDPRFTERECELLSRPNVRAYVVTGPRAAELFREAGVPTPVEIVPQGVDLSSVTAERVEAVSAQRRSDALVVGYAASWLLTAGDRGGDRPTSNIDHLLALWDEIHAAAPDVELWLCGGTSDAVRALCARRPSIRVFGWIPPSDVLAHVANFDVALYPRPAEDRPGVRAIKVAEYVALGVPTVAYDHPATALVGEAGAGVLVDDAQAFVAETVALLHDPARRRQLGERGREHGAAFSWNNLAATYNALLDTYLPEEEPVVGLAPIPEA
jgi:glycosyltransferase involved in cell wall biosynthesis